MDITSSGLKGPEAQLVILDTHVTQLLQLRLPLALWKDRAGRGISKANDEQSQTKRLYFQDRKEREETHSNATDVRGS